MDHHDERRAAAIERLNDKREFKTHATVYVAVNTMLVVIWAVTGRGNFWPIWAIGGWGIALALHAWRTFGQHRFTEEQILRETQRDVS